MDDSSDTMLVVANETVTLDFVMSDTNGGTSEDTISIELTAGNWTQEMLKTAINDVSSVLGYATDGTNKSYDMAEIVVADDGTSTLILNSRDVATSVAMTATDAGGTGTLDFQDSSAVAFGSTTTASAVGVALQTDTWSEDQIEGGVNIATASAAAEALTTVAEAIETKDTARASFGYKMNRLESTISIVDIQAENLQAAESRISDVDVATEMATMTRTQVLAQAGISMLSQANQMPQMAMSLLR
jgi:flagellin